MTKSDIPERKRYLARIRDKKGVTRIYFRAGGIFERLPDPEGSAAFNESYDRLKAKHRPPSKETHSRKPRDLGTDRERLAFMPATIGWFVERYLDSRKFKEFKPGTQKNYRRSLDLLRTRLGAALLVDLDPESVDVYTAEIDREFAPSVADQQKSLISNLWDFAKGFKEFKRGGKSNPTIDTTKRYRVKKEHRPWPEDAQDRFLASAKPPLVLSYLMLRFTGQRGGDATKMRWSDFDGESLQIQQEKTDEQLWLRCPKPLLEALIQAPRISEFILTNSWKRPWANATTLSHAIRRQLAKIGAQGLVMHGLRKTAASDLAELGVGISGIMAVTGHRSAKMALYYTRLADQRRLNASAVDAWDEVIARKQVRDRSAKS